MRASKNPLRGIFLENGSKEFYLSIISHFSIFVNGTPYTIRTCDLQFRKLTLYPAELRVHILHILYHRNLKKSTPVWSGFYKRLPFDQFSDLAFKLFRLCCRRIASNHIALAVHEKLRKVPVDKAFLAAGSLSNF